MSRRGATRPSTKSPPVKSDPDDWETDPDFVRDMDEIDQRWGSKRTVGSINMNELIDEVRKDHKILRDKFDHPSQRDHSDGFGGKFGVQHDRKDQSAQDYDYHEKLSKHTSQEISRKIVTSSVSKSGSVNEAKRTFLEKSENSFKDSRSTPVAETASRPKVYSPSNLTSSSVSDSRPRFEESSKTERVIRKEESSAASSTRGPIDMPPAFKSIQEKINAFKKEFEDIENKVAKKSDLSKVIKKTTNVEKSSNLEYITRSDKDGSINFSSARPTSTNKPSEWSSKLSTDRARDLPKTDIKSLSKKFETLCREDSEDFKRRTEAKRKEFFDQIKTQVRETRKELDGFDAIDDDEDLDEVEHAMREKISHRSSPSMASAQSREPSSSHRQESSPLSRPSSRLSSDSQSSKPKVYTKREMTTEKIVSKVVKENDRIVENESKRNVERSSSFHGSSDEDNGPSSIRQLDQKLRSSPQQRTESPIDRLKREIPIVEPEIKGAGLMARTLYDYQATEADELSFDVDDLITNIEKIHESWYKGLITYKDGRKREGLFPANYVKLLNDSGDY